MCSNHDKTIAKEATQEEFWKSIINKYEDRNANLECDLNQLRQRVNQMDASMPAVMTYNMAKLAKEGPSTDINNLVQSSCVCASCPNDEPQPAQPLKLPDMSKISVFSIESADICYMDKIKQLTEKEKSLINEVNTLKAKEKALKDVQAKVDKLSNSKGGEGVTVRSQDVGSMNESLVKENQRLYDELADYRLELKHLRENLEGPFQRELERERRKNSALEDDLRRKDKECEDKHCSTVRESALLKKQLEANEANLKDMRDINCKFREEITFLIKRNEQLQSDLINQKLSEATTLALMKTELEKKKKRRASSRSSFCTCKDSDSSGGDSKGGGRLVATQQPQQPTVTQVVSNATATLGEKTDQTEQTCPETCSKTTSNKSSLIQKSTPVQIESKETPQDIPVRGPQECPCKLPSDADLYKIARDLSQEIENAKGDKSVPDTLLETACDIKDLCDLIGKTCTNKICIEAGKSEVASVAKSTSKPSKKSKESVCICVLDGECATTTKVETPRSARTSIEKAASNRSPSKDSECVCGWAGECESKISDKSNTPPESGDQDDECICGAVGTCLDDDPGTSATPGKQHETSIDYTLQCDTICDNAVTDSNQISCVTKNTACAANIVQTHTDGVNVTTTFANPGLIEVVTENKDGTISTSMVINDAGNIEVITDVCKKNNCNQIDLVIEDYHSTGDGSSGGRSSHTENDSASKEVCREQCLECASPNIDDKLDTKRSSNEAAGDFVDVKRKSSKIDSYLLEMCPSAPLGFINDRCVTVAYVLNEGAGKTEGAEEQNEHEHQHDSPNIISPHASEYSHGDSDSMSEIIYVDDCGVGTSDGILDHVELSPLARFSSATCDKLAVIQEVDERHNTLQIGSRNKKQVDKIASNNTNDGNRVLHSDVSKPEVISLPMPMTCCPYHGLKLPIAQCLNEYNVEVDNILLKPIEPDCIFDEYFFNKPVNTPKITKPAKDATTAMCPYHGHGGFVENKTEKSQNILGLLTNLATLPLAIPRPEPSVFPVISDQRYSKDQSMASSRPSREVRFDVIQQCSSSALSSNNFPVPQSLSCFSNISEYQTCVNPDAHTFAYSPNTYNAEACSCAYTGASPASSMQPSAWSITEDNKNVQPQSVNIQLRYDVLPEIREDRTQSIQSNTQVDESFMSAPKTGRYPNPSTNYPYIKYDTSVLNSRGIKRTSMDRTSHTRLVTPRTDPEGPPQPPKQVMLNSNANVRQSSFEATDNDFTSLDNTGRYATSSAFENLGDFPGGSKIVVVPQSVIQAGTINDFEQVTIPKDLTQHNPNVQTSNVSGQIRSCWNTKFTSQKAPFVPLDSKLAKYNKKINENTEFVPKACYCVKNQSAPISNVPENQMQQNVSLVNPIQQPQFASNLPNGPTFRECKESCKAVCSAKNLQPIDANSKPCLPTCGGPCSQQHIVYTGAGAQLPLQQNEMKMTPSRNVCVKACTAVCSNTNTVDTNMTVKSKPCVPSCSAICSKTSSVNRGMALSSSGVCAKTCIGVCSNTNTNMNTITNTLGTDRPFEPRPCLPSCSGVCSKSSTLNKVMDLTSSGICANTCTGICSNSNTRANVSAGTSRICQTSCTGVCATLGQDKTDEIFTKPGSPGSKGRICDRTCTAVCSNTNRYGTQRAPQSPNQSIDSGYIGICTKTCTGVCSKSNSYQRQDDMVMESQGTCSPDCTGVCAQSSTTNRRMDTDTSGVCERTCTGVCSKTNAYQGDVGMEQRICSPTSRRIDTKASGICDRTCTGACAINNAYQGDGMESSRTCSPDCTGPCAQSSPNRRIDLTSSNICAKTCTGSCSIANAYKNNMVSTSSNTCFQDCTGICAQSTGINRNMDSSTTTVCAPTCTGVCSSNNGYQGDVVMESSRTCSPDCTGACAKSSTPNKKWNQFLQALVPELAQVFVPLIMDTKVMSLWSLQTLAPQVAQVSVP
ncbi:uncharacterized protein [Atheta coriaria]|uniref:uncharacterized protein isoform X2 n=1 Tax=Dalotia coriaria TaxID=877792 RepID=UPI0031F413D9